MNPKARFALLGLLAAALLLAGYFAFERGSRPVIESGLSDDPAAVATSSEDGIRSGYIKKAYDQGGAEFIEIDYMQTLTGKDAAIWLIENNRCIIETGWTKAQVVAEIKKLEGSDEEIDTAMREMPSFDDYCAPNGWWVDVNENPRLRTFQVALSGPVIMAYDRSSADLGGFGPHKKVEFEELITVNGKNQTVEVSGYEISWETFKKTIAGVAYEIPFKIELSGGKVTAISEIYRP